MVGQFAEIDHPRDLTGRFARKPPAPEVLDRLEAPTTASSDWDPEYDEALAELRSRLEAADGSEPATSAKASVQLAHLTVSGRDLPTLAFTADRPFDASKVEPVATTCHTKPDGGAWLSRLHENGSTDWQTWMAHNKWPGNPSERAARSSHIEQVVLVDDARVLRINSRDDLVAVAAAYPAPHHDGRRAPLDFAGAARDYDAIWVTGRGVSVNHRTAHPDLDGWDLESVLLLNPDAVSARPEARTPVSNDHTWRARP